MENTKAKNIVITILVILLLCCLGVMVWQYMQLNDNKAPEISTQDENKVEESKREDLDINSELVQKLYRYVPSQHYYSNNNLTAYQNKLVTMGDFDNRYLLTCAFFNENTVLDKVESDDLIIQYYFKADSFQDDVKRIYGKELVNESFGLPMERCDYANGIYSYTEGGGSVISYYDLNNVYDAYKIANELYIEDRYMLAEYYYDDLVESWVTDLYTSSNRTTKIAKLPDNSENDEEYDSELNGYKVKYESQAQKYRHTFKLSEEGTYYWYSTEPID